MFALRLMWTFIKESDWFPKQNLFDLGANFQSPGLVD